MKNKISYSTKEFLINEQNMKVKVINLYPCYPEKSKEIIKHEIESKLFNIFKKYIK